MDLSALESAAKALDSRLDSLTFWLWVSTATVVVGLVIEYLQEFVELFKTRSFDRKKLRTLVGGLLITVGVVGELVVAIKSSGVETKLRTTTHKVESLLNGKAADARKEADEAKERASDLEDEAAMLEDDAAALDKEAADLSSKTEQLRKANIEAREKLEAEKRERLALEQFLSPRDPGEQSSLNAALAKFPGITAIVDVVRDAECRRFAAWLVSALPWKVQLNAPIEDSSDDGVTVEYNMLHWLRPGDISNLAAEALVDILNRRKIDSHARATVDRDTPVSKRLAANVIHVIIGLKPTREMAKLMRELWQKGLRPQR